MANGFYDFLLSGNNGLYNDDGSESTATAIYTGFTMATFTSSNLNVNYQYRQRCKWDHVSGSQIFDSGALNANIQMNVNGAGWSSITTTSQWVKMVNSSNLTDGGNTTRRFGDPNNPPDPSNTYDFDGTGQITEDGEAAAVTLTRGQPETTNWVYTESLFSIQFLSANITNGTTIQIRVSDAGTAFGGTYKWSPIFLFDLSSSSSTAQGFFTYWMG